MWCRALGTGADLAPPTMSRPVRRGRACRPPKAGIETALIPCHYWRNLFAMTKPHLTRVRVRPAVGEVVEDPSERALVPRTHYGVIGKSVFTNQELGDSCRETGQPLW